MSRERFSPQRKERHNYPKESDKTMPIGNDETSIEIVQRMLSGDRQSLARLITMVERDAPEVPEIVAGIHRHIGRAHCVGVTGPPGAGKSTLVDKVTAHIRKRDYSVGVLAADPTSPFSGGALLGDRIRMQQHYLDSGVFIRSMATRGSQGGLPLSSKNVIKLMDAAGKDFVLVETVGVGQTEMDIMEASDTVVVVLVPEGGDSIQAMKAGLMEIASIFVVNKADRDGADYLVAEVEAMLRMNSRHADWLPPVIATQALQDTGIDRLCHEIDRHRQYLQSSGLLVQRRRRQRRAEFLEIVQQRLKGQLFKTLENNGHLSVSLAKVESGEIDPYSAARQVLDNKALLHGWLAAL